MYIHIGEDLNIRARDIISILDKESAKSSVMVEEFLLQHEDKVINLSKNPYKSVVITSDKIFYPQLLPGP